MGLVFLFCSPSLRAQTHLTYQGQLFGAHGAVNGSYAMTFRIYESPEGGEALWTETHPDIVVVDGVFLVELGQLRDIGEITPDAASLYLGVTLGDHAEMEPRMLVGTALRAQWANHARDVAGEDIHPRTVSIGNTTVIDAEGRWVGLSGQIAGPAGPEGPIGPAGPPGAAFDVRADRDADSYVDWLEVLSGSDPDDASSRPADMDQDGVPDVLRGASGEPGARGPKGDTGNPGPQGPAGNAGPQGAQGPVGIAGPAGAQGEMGPAGPAGAQGPKGPQGERGFTGEVGPVGPRGPSGPSGASGPAGPQGIQGPTGPEGPRGEQGREGVAGPTGAQGPRGYQGDKGDKGDKGDRGEVGLAGPPGERGLQGPVGLTGETGPAGPRGLEGPRGETGPAGPLGPQGPRGDEGVRGEIGPTGPMGPRGLQGESGAMGPIGARGVEGPKGDKGDQGLIGPSGPKGDPGPAGPMGATGSRGPTGPQGEMGPIGLRGPQGETGLTGLQGPAGEKGETGPTGPPGPVGEKGDTGAAGPGGPAGIQGDTGPAGPGGVSSLVRLSPEPGGSNCSKGGNRIDVGKDDNDDGVLSPGEIDDTRYLCHGESGPQGSTGNPGPAGETGPAGQTGRAGPTGEAGPTGASSLIALLPVDAGLHCVNGGQQVRQGVDGNGNNVLDPDEVNGSQYICNGLTGTQGTKGDKGDSGERGPTGDKGDKGDTGERGLSGDTGPQGLQGTTGNDGLSSLVNVTEVEAGGGCANGGQRLQFGIDANGDGSLAVSEVDVSRLLCNGEDGSDGASGAAGASGKTSRLQVSDAESTSPCGAGGKKIEYGVDDNDDGILTAGEIDSFTYVCNGSPGTTGSQGPQGVPGNDGADGSAGPQGEAGAQGPQGIQGIQGEPGPTGRTTLLSTTPIAPSTACATGGVQLNIGIDDDGDGALDSAEIQQTQHVCNGIDQDGDSTLSEAEVDAFVANNGFVLSSSLHAVATSGSFTDLVNVPTTLLDGDDDTQLTEAEVDAFVSDNGFAMAANLSQVASTGSFDDLLNIPTDLADGDDDTQLTELEVDSYVSNNGFARTTDLAVVSTSGDFGDLSNIPPGISDGDDDTQLSEAQVDLYVANNNYASQTDVSALQNSVSELLTLINSNQTANTSEINALKTRVATLESSVATLQTQMSSLQNGPVQLGASNVSCDASVEGQLRYQNEQVEVCNGTEWALMYRKAPSQSGDTQANAGVSCKTIFDNDLGNTDGTYWIDPDGNGLTGDAFQVHCNMTTQGGGWTLVATLSNVDGIRSWSHTSPQFGAWLDNTSLINTTPLLSTDYKSQAYGLLSATQLMVETDKGVSGVWAGVNGTLLSRISAEASACNSTPPATATLPLVTATVAQLRRDMWINAVDGNSAGSCALSNQSNPSDSAVLSFSGTQGLGVNNGSGWQGIGQAWEQNIKNSRSPAVTCNTSSDCMEDFASAYGWEQASSDETFVTTIFNDGNSALEPDVIRIYVR